jgi:hypothetical protein
MHAMHTPKPSLPTSRLPTKTNPVGGAEAPLICMQVPLTGRQKHFLSLATSCMRRTHVQEPSFNNPLITQERAALCRYFACQEPLLMHHCARSRP